MAIVSRPSSPEPSALQKLLDAAGARTPTEALPQEIMHNLRYQHNWTNLEMLRLHTPNPEEVPSMSLSERSSSRTRASATPTLLSGTPPCPIYIHPAHQAYLLLQRTPIESLEAQTEYLFPLTLGQTFTLRMLQAAFDSIPSRAAITDENGFRHQDSKRLLLAMRGRQGVGGDGTVNYYIVQEGEVKPRQN